MKQRKWATTADALRNRPGEWALVVPAGVAKSKRRAQDTARYIRNGSRVMPKGEFDAVTRGDQVFAVYTGGDSDARQG